MTKTRYTHYSILDRRASLSRLNVISFYLAPSFCWFFSVKNSKCKIKESRIATFKLKGNDAVKPFCIDLCVHERVALQASSFVFFVSCVFIPDRAVCSRSSWKDRQGKQTRNLNHALESVCRLHILHPVLSWDWRLKVLLLCLEGLPCLPVCRSVLRRCCQVFNSNARDYFVRKKE